VKCEKSYEEIHEEVQKAELLHIDETGHRLQGKRGWAWVFANSQTTLIKLKESRGAKVLQEMLPGYEGKIISDRYSSYSYFSEEKRQVCWSHLSRDFERFAQSRDPDLSFIGKEMHQIAVEILSLHRSLLAKKIEQTFFLRRCRILRKRLLYWLKKPYGLPRLEQAKRVCKNILKTEKMMWLFLEDPLRIPPTNNLAERQIRKYVVYRKTSYFAWAERGERYLERMLSLFLTYQKENPFQKLLQILEPGLVPIPLT
jgi:transposase